MINNPIENEHSFPLEVAAGLGDSVARQFLAGCFEGKIFGNDPDIVKWVSYQFAVLKGEKARLPNNVEAFLVYQWVLGDGPSEYSFCVPVPKRLASLAVREKIEEILEDGISARNNLKEKESRTPIKISVGEMDVFPRQGKVNACPLDLIVLAVFRYALRPPDVEVVDKTTSQKRTLVFPTSYSFLSNGAIYWWQEGQPIEGGGTHLEYSLAILTSQQQKELIGRF